MSDGPADAFEIRSEARGPHWIAWVTRDRRDTPEGAVVLVGQTRSEAEARARAWATRLVMDPSGSSS